MSGCVAGALWCCVAPLLCKIWLVVASAASTVWAADLISRNSNSVNLLQAAHAVDLLVNFDVQARATFLSKAAVLIRVLVR